MISFLQKVLYTSLFFCEVCEENCLYYSKIFLAALMMLNSYHQKFLSCNAVSRMNVPLKIEMYVSIQHKSYFIV